MKPYYEHGGVTIYHGDCREVLADGGFPGCCIVTDPPYSSGGFQESGRTAGSIGTQREGGRPVIRMDNLSTRGYRRLIRSVIDLSLASELYMFTDWRMWIESFDCAEDAGLRVRAMIVWDKLVPGMGSPWRHQHELILYAVREKPKSKWGLGTVRSHKRSGNHNHPTEKPTALLHDILRMVDRDVEVLDPFAGSGSTLVAAKADGRRAIGIEIEEAFCEVAAKRLEQEVMLFDGEENVASQNAMPLETSA